MSERVVGAAPPAPTRRGTLIRVLGSEAMTFICLSENPYGEWVHWWCNRSHECKHDKGLCQGCQKGWPSKWKCYFNVSHDGSTTDLFLELTAAAFHALEAQAPKGENFRGLMFRIRRTKGGAKGRYICEVLPRRLTEEELVPERDPRGLLTFLRSCKRPAGQETT